MRTGVVLVFSLSLFGCAAVFRGSKDQVVVESDPAGADTHKGDKNLGVTPTVIDVERRGMTQLTLRKRGFDEHHGIVKKKMNGGWLAADLITCPFLLCIPLIIDASTGAWTDVEHKYAAHLSPSGAGGSSPFSTARGSGPAPVGTSGAFAAGPPPDMTEGERKSTARAAFLAGVSLQEKGECPGAIPKFELAQQYFKAPTHLFHLGQCQAAVGKLLEASETYTLLQAPLAADASDAFRQAQEDGKRELARIKPRIPSLRVQTSPASSSLSGVIVKMNDVTIPNELLDVMRPVNPGSYKVTVLAAGYKEASQRVELAEGSTQSVTVVLKK